MDFRGQLLAPCAIRKEGPDIEVDFLAGEFLERLILFDKFILDSIRLREIPHLVRLFGYESVLELLKSGVLSIHSETFVGYASTGRASGALASRAKKGDLPLCSYCLDPISIHPYDDTALNGRNHEKIEKQFTHLNLQLFDQIDSISCKQAQKLRETVANRVIRFSSESIITEISKQNYRDFRNHNAAIRVAMALKIRDMLNQDINPDSIEIKFDFIDEDDFRVESNIEKKLSLDKETTHKIIERALLGITGTNHLIAKMKEFNCLVGYRENEVPIFDSKLSFLDERVVSDKRLTPNFRRILSAKGLPDFSGAVAEGRIDLQKLLEVRESRECVDFRTWLWSQDNIKENELRERLNAVKPPKLGSPLKLDICI